MKMHLHVGQALGPYQLLRPLDQRSEIEVWLGLDPSRHILVALKILRRDGLWAEEYLRYRKRLDNEAWALDALSHLHIVGLIDYRLSRKFLYIVMQYAPGGSVAHRHSLGRKLPLSLVRLYTWQIGHALSAMHLRGLIHRDVKPGNILLLNQHHALLADFGLAMYDPALSNQQKLNRSGTPAYMAPEQYHGYPRPASDQYSLATSVYEWLTGHRPFSGTTVQMMRRRERFAPLPVRNFRPELPAAVDEILLTALHPDPAQRYPTVLDFARDFVAVTRIARPPLVKRIPYYRGTPCPETEGIEDELPSTLPPETGERRLFSLLHV